MPLQQWEPWGVLSFADNLAGSGRVGPWVRNNLLMHAGRFYETTVLSYAQAEQAVVAGGKVIKTPKDRLKTQHGLRRGRETIRVVTLRAESAGDDLVDIFGRFVASRYSQAA